MSRDLVKIRFYKIFHYSWVRHYRAVPSVLPCVAAEVKPRFNGFQVTDCYCLLLPAIVQISIFASIEIKSIAF